MIQRAIGRTLFGWARLGWARLGWAVGGMIFGLMVAGVWSDAGHATSMPGGSIAIFQDEPDGGSESTATGASRLSGVSRVSPPSVLSEQPGFDRYQKLNEVRNQVGAGGRVSNVVWAADGSSVSFTRGSSRLKANTSTGMVEEVPTAREQPAAGGRERRAQNQEERSSTQGRQRGAQSQRRDSIPVAPVSRAQQRRWAVSPDYRWKAQYHENNLYLETIEPGSSVESAAPSAQAIPVTSDGNDKIRYGTCCWVYGEELNQSDAIWWSPDSKTLAFYRVAESHMTDFHLSAKNTELYPQIETTRYPKAGDPNPHVALILYDLETKNRCEVLVDGPEDQYLYNISFTPDGRYLKFNRTNRWQDELDVMLADIQTGDVRSVVRESQETWQKNSPLFRWLGDGQRFIWETERSGYKAFELRHVDGRKLHELTPSKNFPVGRVLEVDEEKGWLYFEAFPEMNPYHAQIFRSRLDVEQDVEQDGEQDGERIERLTQQNLNHTFFSVSPDHDFYIATCESPTAPPQTILYRISGDVLAELATCDGLIQKEMGIQAPEVFSFTANDGVTTIWGVLYKPSNYDPGRRYPVVIDVYGGPSSGAFSNRYGAGNPACEFGFLIAKVGNRGTSGRGKAFEGAGYQLLGDLDIQDQADAVRFLAQRPDVDAERVGIYGHSYGGYLSALAVLKHPDVFHVAVSGAPVTDWRNYDTIYTERFMRTPQVNEAGYQQGSCVALAGNLRGRLLLVHGLEDDNVHPTNTWQLCEALHKEGKRFDLQIYPGFRHGVGSTYNHVRWEYLCLHLQP